MRTDALDPVTQQHVLRAVDSLAEEFGDSQSRETIERVMEDSVAQLAGSVAVDDFIATRVREDIDRRVHELLLELDPAAGGQAASQSG